MAKAPSILWCFALYVSIILVFALAYYLLYRYRQSFFLFGTDLAESQRQTVQSRSERLVRALQTIQTALPGYANAVKSGIPLASLAEHQGKTTLADGCSYGLRRELRAGPRKLRHRLPPQDLVCIEVLDLDGSQILYEPVACISPRSRNDEEAIEDYFQGALTRLKRERERLSALRSPDTRIWSFWDFFYFSAVCQTTVGFGDILPNATTVRLLVVSQILIGYGVLVVLLNIILTR